MNISAIITYYNASETIERVLNSIKMQTQKVDEIIIVDDSSYDSKILNEIVNKFNDIKIIRNRKNIGYPASLNRGISISNGEFVFIFDDDDHSLETRVEEQLKYFEKGYDMIYSSRNTYVNNKFKNLNTCINSNFSFDKNFIPRYILAGDTINGKIIGEFGSCTLALRKSVCQQLSGFDESFRRKAEWDFVIRASLNGFKIFGIQRPLVNQFKTVGLGDEKSLKMSLNMDKLLLAKHKLFLKHNKIYLTSMFYLKSRTNSFYGKRINWFFCVNLYRIFRFINY